MTYDGTKMRKSDYSAQLGLARFTSLSTFSLVFPLDQDAAMRSSINMTSQNFVCRCTACTSNDVEDSDWEEAEGQIWVYLSAC